MAERVVVLGGGESGVGAAVLAKQKGREVFLSDAAKLKEKYKNVLSNHEIAFEEGGHSVDKIHQADLVIKSPGIPRSSTLIQQVLAKDIPVISEIEFATRFIDAKYVTITGSNGKTTTSLMTHHILSKSGLSVGLAGNIGESLAMQVAEGELKEWYVLELSSFQLEDTVDFKADVAILLNITEDHLDRYEYDIMKYAAAKLRIANHQTKSDWFIYNLDDPIIAKAMDDLNIQAVKAPFSIKQETKGISAYATENELIINPNNNPLTMTIQELALQGKHNLYNSMASGIAARILDVRKELIRECLSDFQNIEHRLERVNQVYGITFINDSKATNVNSAWYALESMTEPVIWIAGGVDKGNDYSQILDMVKGKVKAIVCLGKDNAKLKKAFTDVVPIIAEAETMRDAVYQAYKFGEKGDAVLLSPACASFDLFQDYEDRGRQFKEAVRNL